MRLRGTGKSRAAFEMHSQITFLAFLTAWDRRDPIIIHCRAGIGRSTATAFIAACLKNPHTDDREIAVELRRASPLARPNETLIRLADGEMRRDGRMREAIAETGHDLPWIDVDEGRGRGSVQAK